MSPELMVFSTGLTPEQHTCFLCMTHPCLLMLRTPDSASAPSLGATLDSMITNKSTKTPKQPAARQTRKQESAASSFQTARDRHVVLAQVFYCSLDIFKHLRKHGGC